MPSCVIRYCTNYTSKTTKSGGITYHSFPSDDLTKHKWVSIVQAERNEHDWMPSKSSTICSAHFKQEDKYTTTKGYLRLKKTALPVISPEQAVPRAESPNSLDNVDISDLDYVFDTPAEAALKKIIEKIKLDKKKLLKRNIALARQNRIYKKRLSSVNYMLKVLLKKNVLSQELYTELNLKCVINSVKQKIDEDEDD